MILQLFLTLLCITVPFLTGLLVFGGILLLGLEWVDRTAK